MPELKKQLHVVCCVVFRGDVAYFDGLIETILAVGLVKPKQGMKRRLLS